MQADPPARASRALPVLVASGAGLLTMLWVGAVCLMAHRGLDLTDESFYLVSYRWWDSLPRTVSGSQYIYGPVFGVLGHNVPALRMFRLFTVVAAHGVFGWAFMSWLRTQRPMAPATRAWEVAGTFVIVAAAGVVYGWLPLSPGYNDVALLGTVLLAATVLRAVRGASLTGQLPLWPAGVAGVLALLLLLAKWTSAAATLTFVAALGGLALAATRPRGWTRFTLAGLGGLAGASLLLHVFVIRLPELISPMIETNRLVAASTNSPTNLLGMYLRTGLDLLMHALVIAAIAAALVAVGALVRRTWPKLGRLVTMSAAPAALVFVFPSRFGIPGGGAAALPRYPTALVAMAALVVISLGIHRRTSQPRGGDIGSIDRRRHRLLESSLLIMLILLPVVQALGTGNPVAFLAVGGMPLWVAGFVAAVTAMQAGTLPRTVALSSTATALVVATTTGVSGAMLHPYRTTSFEESDHAAATTGVLAELRVGAQEARQLSSVRKALAGVSTEGRPMMAFDELPGLILMLGGHPVGEAWFSRLDRERSAAGIRAACERGNPWGSRQPILFFNRETAATDRAALNACDLDIDQDYRAVSVPGWKPSLTAYVPIVENVDE